MKKIVSIYISICIVGVLNAQQIGSGNMESWDAVGTANEEPTNWNSFKSGQGNFVAFASQQIQQSTSIRAGATGTYAARIWSKSTLGVVANGNMTLGRINMGSTTANSPDNYNFSVVSDPLFSETIENAPDSLVFWAKYTNSNASDSARLKAVIHDNFEVRDPMDANSEPHIIGTAVLNYAHTQGEWKRFSVPFQYQNSNAPAFILVTFTTNKTPGGGGANDEVLIDDVELVYSTNTLEENDFSSITVFYAQGIHFKKEFDEVQITSLSGQDIVHATSEKLEGFLLPKGVYLVKLNNEIIRLFVP